MSAVLGRFLQCLRKTLRLIKRVEFQMSFKPLKLHKENENKQIVSHDFMSVTELKLNKQLFLLQCSDV